MAAESDENEVIFRNVAELKRRLHQTEVSLQKLQTPRPASLTESESQDLLSLLSLRDLDDNDDGHLSSRSSLHEHSQKEYSNYGSRRSDLKQSKERVTETSSHGSLIDKLHRLRQQNSQLVKENNRLQNEMESFTLALKSSQQHVLHGKDEITQLKKQVKNLKSDLKVTKEDLRSSERELERSLSRQQSWEDFINQCRTEVKNVTADLRAEIENRQRTEKEADEASQQLHSLKLEMKTYESRIEEELKQREKTEQHLHTSLQHCDKEREELLKKATTLEEELQVAREEVRHLKGNLVSLSGTQKTTEELEEVITGQERQIKLLKEKLEEANKEKKELKERNEQQMKQLKIVKEDVDRSEVEIKHLRDIVQKSDTRRRAHSITSESSLSTISHTGPGFDKHFYLSPESARLDGVGAESQEETNTLEAVDVGKRSPRTAAAELRMKEAIRNAEQQRNQARLQQMSAGLSPDQSVMDSLRVELLTIVEQSKIDSRKSAHFQEIISKLDEERGQQGKMLNSMQNEIDELKEEKDALERQHKLRDSHFTQIQKDMEEKASRLSHLTQELQRKELQVVSLESQLEKTVSDFREQLASLSDVDSRLTEETERH